MSVTPSNTAINENSTSRSTPLTEERTPSETSVGERIESTPSHLSVTPLATSPAISPTSNTPPSVKIATTYYRKKRKFLNADPDAPQGLWDRILQTLLVTLIYAVIGFLVDGIIYMVKAMSSTAPVSMFWLFLPILTVLGLILGWLMGGRALDALLIPFQTRDNPTFDEASFGYGMMKAIGIGLILAVLGWLILMMFT